MVVIWRLYISYKCPYAQRVWITRNCKVLLRVLFNSISPYYSSFYNFLLWVLSCIFLYYWLQHEQGLQDKIELVPIDLQNRPAWYKEKVNPANKVPLHWLFSFCIHGTSDYSWCVYGLSVSCEDCVANLHSCRFLYMLTWCL